MTLNLSEWINKRFPLKKFIEQELTEYPTPRTLNYWWGFGFLAGFLLVLQIVSGVFLAMHYKADASLAFDSVQYIMREVNYGWLIRYLHTTGSSAFFIVIYVHMARTLYYASYHAPRELLWWTGQVLLLLIMATAFMGYTLPWGQMSYWGAEVITDLLRATPAIGESLVAWIRGGYSVGDATLTRFFALHYLLPFIIAGAVIIHLIALHHVKSSNPSGVDPDPKGDIPFHPFYTVKDLYQLGLFLIIFCFFVFFYPQAFIQSDNNIPANHLLTPPHIMPEWYFLPFYAILRSVPDLAGGVVAMALSILIFAILPYIDRCKITGGAHTRPVYRALFYIFIIDILVLGYVGAKPPGGLLLVVGRIATAIYFLVFLLLPFVSKKEEQWLRARGYPGIVQQPDKTKQSQSTTAE
jgi:quinol-cytochrome oxidoreductase complex cytochrome b subunit